MEKVLAGIRVVDLSRYLSGPYCTQILADMGAEVIRVEKPGGEEDREIGALTQSGDGCSFITLGRNKLGATLNLRDSRGKELLLDLVKISDILVHNYVVGFLEECGLDYESLKKVNPRLIVVAVTGYGQYGPYSKQLCFDPVAQAMSGAMTMTGFPGNPPTRVQAPYVDLGTALHGAVGCLLALYHRERTGQGQLVDVSLLDTAISFMYGMYAEYKLLGKLRQPIGNHSHYNLSDLFKAKDGWVFVSIVGNPQWRRSARLLGREELIQDKRFESDESRFEHRDVIDPLVAAWVAERTVSQCISDLTEARIPCGRLFTVPEVVDDPHTKAREMLVDMEYPGAGLVPLIGLPIKLSVTPGEISHRAPQVGEHNEYVYCELLGRKPEELRHLADEGVV